MEFVFQGREENPHITNLFGSYKTLVTENVTELTLP